MSHEIMTKEARDQLDTMVLTDVRERIGSRSLVCIETMRFVAAAAGAGRTKGAIDRSLQRLRKKGFVAHTADMGWRAVPTCGDCKKPLPASVPSVRTRGRAAHESPPYWCPEHVPEGAVPL